MSEGILLFDNGSSSGSAGGNAFDQAAFNDISLPATNNTGFSSTVSRNPLGGFYANDFAPKFRAKELFFVDLILVSDKSKWISGRPTYKILFSENFPGVDAYAFGNIQIRGTDECRYFVCLDAGDGVSVTGTMVNMAWNFMPVPDNAGTALTAAATTDASSIGNLVTSTTYSNSTFADTANFGGGIYIQKSIQNYKVHSATNQSYNIHTYQVTANSPGGLALQGILPYFEIPNFGINLFAGDGFINKSSVTATGSSLAYPLGVSNLLGGVISVYVTAAGAFGATLSPIPSQSSVALGSSGTNQVAVTSGTGASFPAGSGIYIQAGASNFLGFVQSVSTDTLTIGPTLPYGVSGTISSICAIGNSFAVSATLFSPYFSFEPDKNHKILGSSLVPQYPVVNQTIGGATALFTYSDPQLRYRVTGMSLAFAFGSSFTSGFTSPVFGVPPVLNDAFGIAMGGGTHVFEVAGRFSALDLEFWCGVSAILKATFAIDGMGFGSFNETVSGPAKINRTVLGYAGHGWHTANFNFVGSTEIILTRVRGYSPNGYNGPSFGVLGEILVGQTLIVNPASNVSGTTFTTGIGNIKRLYADNLMATKGNTGSIAAQLLAGAFGGSFNPVGGVALTNSNPTTYADIGLFGKGFCISGITYPSTVGFSGFVIANGVSSGISLGYWVTYSQATFLTLQVFNTAAGITNVGAITAVDVLLDDSIRNRQNFFPVTGTSSTPSFFNSPTVPNNAKTGDFWQQDQNTAYQNLFGGWQQLNVRQPFAAFEIGASGIALPNATSPFGYSMAITVSDRFAMRILGATFALAIPVDGNWVITGAVSFGANSTGVREHWITINGASYLTNAQAPSAAETTGFNYSIFMPSLKKGAVIFPTAICNAGATFQMSGGAGLGYLGIYRVGP